MCPRKKPNRSKGSCGYNDSYIFHVVIILEKKMLEAFP